MSSITYKRLKTVVIISFWILIWAFVAHIVGEQLLIASPYDVVLALISLLGEGEFYTSIANTCFKIAMGFCLSFVLGILFAVICYKVNILKELFSPLIHLFRSVPVASIVIVILIWISSKNLSIVTSFMMTFPVIYENTMTGLLNVDKKLLEMAKVFRFSNKNKIKAIYLPSVMPTLESAVILSLGMCWKSGVAAEIIGLPNGTIGEKLYQAKVFFDTPSVFAWTVVIVLLSFLFEKGFATVIKKGVSKWKP